MNYETILYHKEGPTAIITLNRPKSMNALNNAMLSELRLVTEEIEEDEQVGVAIITGRDTFFAAGADLKEIADIHTPVAAHGLTKCAQSAVNRIEKMEKPVIAAVNGLALGGGCELALACDIRLAAESASFGLPEIKLGLLPGAGGTQRLPRLIGVGLAKEMLYCGDSIDAQEAYRIGLVNKICPPGSLLQEAKILAEKMSKRPRLALKTIKTLVNSGLDMSLFSALCHEARCFELLFATEDQKEGVKAFVEKRKPQFAGR